MRLATSTALLLATVLLSACGGGADKTATTQPAPPALSEADKQKLLASLPAPYNTADLANGQSKFALCRSCHTIVAGGPNMSGPNLHGLFGHKAGTHGDFNHSEALKASGITWDAASLDAWLESPRKLVPGTKMAFAGIKDAKDRADLIGYLKVEAGDAQAH